MTMMKTCPTESLFGRQEVVIRAQTTSSRGAGGRAAGKAAVGKERAAASCQHSLAAAALFNSTGRVGGRWSSGGRNSSARGQVQVKSSWKFWEKEEKEDPFMAQDTIDVKELLAVRFKKNDVGNVMGIEYLVRWSDTPEETWEPAQNIAEDLLRDFETKWWTAAKQGDEYTLREVATGSEEVMSSARDLEGRTALHYTCGTGNERCTGYLLECGSDVNARDKDGYTPLHIAAGYVHVNTVRTLVRYGADPVIEDNANRTVLQLVKNLENNTPKSDPNLFRRRLQLREVSTALTQVVYDEVLPANLLDKKEVVTAGTPVKDGALPTETQYLVRWSDDEEDTWVSAEHIAEDLVEDYEAGLEYSDATQILDRRTTMFGDVSTVEYLVEWADGAEASWEPESHITELLVREFEEGLAPGAKLMEAASTSDATAQVGGSI